MRIPPEAGLPSSIERLFIAPPGNDDHPTDPMVPQAASNNLTKKKKQVLKTPYTLNQDRDKFIGKKKQIKIRTKMI